MAHHRHDDNHEMIVVLRGQIETHIAGKTLRGESGSVLFYPQGFAHKETAVGGAALETLFVGFQTGPAGANLGAKPIVSFDQTGRIQMLVQWMHELSPAQQMVQHVTQAALLQAVLYELTRHSAFNLPSTQTAHAAINYMREHLAEPLRLTDIAAAVHLSPFHFSRLFRRHVGQSPMRFLTQCRVEAARGFLLGSDLPIKAIAHRTGLSDPFHFSRTFHRVAGYPPNHLRRPTLLSE